MYVQTSVTKPYNNENQAIITITAGCIDTMPSSCSTSKSYPPVA